MPRDGGFLREVAARDKTWSQQAGDPPPSWAPKTFAPISGTHSREPRYAQEGKDNMC